MPTMAFAIPVKPGAYDEIKAHHDELIHGLDADDHAAHHRDRGVRTLQVFYQKEPVELLIFYVDADNVADLIGNPAHQGHATTQVWQSFLASVAGADRRRGSRPELMIDWHHVEGHRHRHR